ncbi:MAG: neutral/alkaline non-lysosomal ceramidase N-terminal domain-containing protein [Lachnospiraceae bacterium]|nr:neutral/alkaline non-lysosomal ceramidase N-terminal domain-containing protein [Lachnospiraceae bacterium]
MGKLMASAGKECITPPESMYPAPSFLPIEFEGVYQDLYVRALVLDNGQDKMALITYDAADMSRSADMCRALGEAYGFKKENLCFAATHSHEAPTFDNTHDGNIGDPEKMKWVMAYGDLVIAQTVKAVGAALDTMRPAKICYHTGESYVNVCRDEQFEDGTWGQGMDFTGPCDHTVALLQVRDLNDRIIAQWINFGVHGTCCYMQMDQEHKKFLMAGDLPGMTSAYLEERYQEDGAVFLWCSGAAANVNPIFGSDYYKYNHDKSHASVALGYEAWDRCEALAERHAVDIIKIMNSIQPEEFAEDIDFDVVERTVSLPGQKLVRKDGTAGMIIPGNHSIELDILDAEPQNLRLKLMVLTMKDVQNCFSAAGGYVRSENLSSANGDESASVTDIASQKADSSHAANPSQVALLSMNAELVAEIGMRLKEAVPFENLVIVTHAGERIGYLPDKSGYDRRTFAFYTSKVKDGVTEERITPVILEMCDELS